MTDPHGLGFSDYVVYVDESGDHSLVSIDAGFPVFALTFCVFRKADYAQQVIPAMETFKFDFWGHDAVIMHEADIRKSSGPFNILLNAETREAFFERLNPLLSGARFDIIAAVIDKRRHVARYSAPMSPYEIALLFCMERLLSFLIERDQQGRRVHVIFESRGKSEDRELEAEFSRICNNEVRWGYRAMDFSQIRFESIFTKKDANSTGLQLADLTARPIALRTVRPGQGNRAYDLIRPKIRYQKVFP
ncbi:DUF3800 domain-containing protein [Microbacterium marinilacus]|uniref:DUF3800 domain-containing protein n=1 Tax=Microbacterium marinilacus TaxID=415209 RepID=A0ABP7BRI5_9MICO|nr:DUF3800 domain-containing protein [Microbacterium marinilacus]